MVRGVVLVGLLAVAVGCSGSGKDAADSPTGSTTTSIDSTTTTTRIEPTTTTNLLDTVVPGSGPWRCLGVVPDLSLGQQVVDPLTGDLYGIGEQGLVRVSLTDQSVTEIPVDGSPIDMVPDWDRRRLFVRVVDDDPDVEDSWLLVFDLETDEQISRLVDGPRISPIAVDPTTGALWELLDWQSGDNPVAVVDPLTGDHLAEFEETTFFTNRLPGVFIDPAYGRAFVGQLVIDTDELEVVQQLPLQIEVELFDPVRHRVIGFGEYPGGDSGTWGFFSVGPDLEVDHHPYEAPQYGEVLDLSSGYLHTERGAVFDADAGTVGEASDPTAGAWWLDQGDDIAFDYAGRLFVMDPALDNEPGALVVVDPGTTEPVRLEGPWSGLTLDPRRGNAWAGGPRGRQLERSAPAAPPPFVATFLIGRSDAAEPTPCEAFLAQRD